MKVRDEAMWQQQVAEFDRDPNPMAKDFQRFVETWAEMAEEGRKFENLGTLFQDRTPTPIEALRQSLRTAEIRAGRWTIGFLGQALLLLASHWGEIEDIQRFYDSMTPIEQNIYNDVAAVWVNEKEKQAQESGNA